MKRLTTFFFILFVGMTISHKADAQIWKHIKHKVKKHVTKDVDSTIDKAIEKAKNAAKSNKRDKSKDSINSRSNGVAALGDSVSAQGNGGTASLADYKNYDFVPGDKILFVSNFKNQRNASLPARLGLVQGTAEVQTYQGDKVLELERGSDVTLIPMMKKKNYLPDQFTVEFDLLVPKIDNGYKSFAVFFFKPNTEKMDLKAPLDKEKHFKFEIDVGNKGAIDLGHSIESKIPRPALSKSLTTPGGWHHIAIYIHNNIGKAYIDQYRVAASNMILTGVTKLAIKTQGDLEYLIKNARLAAGGSDVYQKIVSDGKFVTHGIHFTFDKSDILPESMGTINEIYQMLKNHSDLKLEIDGYTDSDGSKDYNLKLSQQRAKSVKKQLVKMGIDDGRLTTKGFGESNPVETNSTPEGKANNRRVEFVKI
jgi:outer membrane protein OmpA-like peptidoglycan-associated protein